MIYQDFRNLKLSTTPQNIKVNVEYLDLSSNYLSKLPDDFDKYQQLKILFLSNNNFQSIPKILSKMTSLYMVSFRNNKISEVNFLPEKLEWLILTNNSINKIYSIGKLVNLKKLMLSGNMLNTLPKDIVNCQKIELLRLSNNQFSKIPECIFELNNLAWISMANNPCFPLPNLNKNKDYIDVKFIENICQIGEGTAGKVYKSIFNNNKVAVKHYKSKMTSDGLSTNEMYILSSIKKHKNLIEIIGYVYNTTKEDINGIIMPLFDNYNSVGLPPSFETITRDVYNKEIIEPGYIIDQIEKATNHLHKNNIIHGDLYSHNIIYNIEKQHAVLTDLGASFKVIDKKLLDKFITIEQRALTIFKNELLDKFQ